MSRQYRVGDEAVPGYRLTQEIGRGRFGSVWRATIPRGTEVALKIVAFDSADIKKIRSLRLLTQIKHPHIVGVRALWLKDIDGNVVDPNAIDSGRTITPLAEAVLAMDLAQKSLGDRLRECIDARWPGIPPEELLAFLEGAARGIDYLSQPHFDSGSGPAPLPHCNIKPSNILLYAGTAKLGDAGLAHALGDSAGSLGTSAYYQAPELFLQGRPSPTTDQYSLAVTYTELRTGSLPVQAESLHKIIACHLQGTLDLSRLPEAEQSVIRRAISVDPANRYPTALEFIRALRQTQQRASSSPPPRGGVPPPKIADGHIMLQPGVEIVPGYRLIRLLGRGGYGEVWESSAPGHLRIALKIVRNLDANTGRQEFKALQLIKNVNHAYLLALHAYWLLDAQGSVISDDAIDGPNPPAPSVLILATRLADKSLMQRFKECQKEGLTGIPADELIEYMRHSASAIDYLNAERHPMGDRLASIQHRDIKPENILLTPGAALVADFGLARLLQGSQSRVSADSMGLTPLYAAPELLAGSVSRWTDQYSLALTYYHLRTGVTPFHKDPSPYAVIQAHLEGKLDLSELAEPERVVIARATSRDAPARWPNCVEMVKALQQALVPSHQPAGPGGPSPLPGSPAARPDTGGAERESTADPYQFETVMVPPAAPVAATGGIGSIELPGHPRKKTTGVKIPPVPPTAAPEKGPGAGPTSAWAMKKQRPSGFRGLKRALLAVLVLAAVGAAGFYTWPYWRDWVGFGPPLFTPEQVKLEIREAHYPRALEMIAASRLGRQTQAELRGEVRTAWLKDIEVVVERSQDGLVDDMTVEMLQFFPDDSDALHHRRTALDRYLRPKVEKAVKDQQFGEAMALLDKPHYDSPGRTELRNSIRSVWLEQARGQMNANRPSDAVAILDRVLASFPDDRDAASLRRSAKRDIVVGEINRLMTAGEFPEAGKLIVGERDVIGSTPAEELKTKLIEAWMEGVARESKEPQQIKLLRDLLAFNEDKRARVLLEKLDPTSKKIDPAIEKRLAGRLAEAEKLLADKAPEALKIVNEVLQSQEILTLPAIRHRATFDKARALARTRDWTPLPATLADFSGELSPTERATKLVLSLLAEEARGTAPADLLNSLAEVRKSEKALTSHYSWERQQYEEARDRVMAKLIRDATELAQSAAGKPPRLDEALALIDKALQSEPDHVATLLARGDLLYRKGSFAEVKKLLEKATPLTKKSTDQVELDVLTTLVRFRPDASAAEQAEGVKRLPAVGKISTPRLVELCVVVADAAHKTPALRSPAATWLRKAYPTLTADSDKKRVGELVTLLHRDTIGDAEKLLKASNFPALTAALNDAEILALDVAAQTEVDALRALSGLSQPGERAKAMPLVQRLIALPTVPRAMELGNALIQSAPTDEASLKEVQQAVTQLIAKIPAQADKDSLQRSLRGLADSAVRGRLNVVDKQPDWSQLLKEFRQGEPSDWKRVGQAECLLSQNKKVAAADLKLARDLLDAKPPPDAGPYFHYVRALVYRQDNNPTMAGAGMLEAYRVEPAPAYLGGFRRDRAVAVLRDAVSSLRSDADDLTNPARSPFRAVFSSPTAAEKAIPLLEKSQQLVRAAGQSPALDTMILHAIALSQQSKPDAVASIKAIDAVLASPADQLGSARMVLLLAKARLQTSTPPGKKAALEAYEETATQLLPRASHDEQLASEFYEQVIEKGLQLADKWPEVATDAELRKRLARLHGAAGQIVSNYPAIKWPFRDEPIKRAIDAYTEAIKLDGSRPDYYIGRGLARSLLPEPDLTGTAADVKAAMAQGGDTMAGAHNLRGYVLLLQSRQEPDPVQRVAQLRQAVEACSKAVALRRKQEDDPADFGILLNNLSTAALDLGNFLSDATDKRKFFTEARAAAEEATRLKNARELDTAWRALGNVLEDIGWQLGEPKYYDDALKAFDQAVQKRPAHPKAYIDRARCLWRAVTTAGRNKTDLARAEKDLQAALDRKPSPDDHVQALSWLGMVYLAREDYSKAGSLAFDDAIKLAASNRAAAWPRYVLDWSRAAVSESSRLRAKDPKSKASAELLEGARKAAERTFESLKGRTRSLDEAWRLEAAMLLGPIHESQSYPLRGLRVYLDAWPDLAAMEALADDKLADGTGLRFRFLLARGALLLGQYSNPEFAKVVTSTGGPIEAARRDLALAVRLAGIDKSLGDQDQMNAYGLSGLAHERAATVNKQDKFLTIAAEHLDKAYRFPMAPKAADYWFWRFRLGDVSSKLMATAPAAKRAQLYQDGLDNYQAALGVAPATYQDAIRKAIEAHKTKKP